MLSPNDIVPKSKAASIWSFDSGYGSNSLEDDETFQVDYNASSPTHQTYPQSRPQPLGLGLGDFWNLHVEDQLQRSESPIEPITTKLNVFTAKTDSSTDFLLPSLSDTQDACVTCQLWNTTSPGKDLRCDNCRMNDFITPQALYSDGHLNSKLAVPRLEIPHEQQLEKTSKTDPTTRCSACEISTLINPTKPSSCNSCTPDPGLLSPTSPIRPSKVKRSCARRPAKLPSLALRCLQTWLRDNRNNPYPDAETKRSLAQGCGITEKQVNTWFTNARARRLNNSGDRSNPPSEDEGNFDSRFPSVASTPFDRRCSDTSNLAANGFQQTASATSRRGKKKDYSWIETVSPIDNPTSTVPPTPPTAPATRNGNDSETWQCTFCYQRIAPKSWRRHEETQHRPKRKWTCLLNGPQLTLPSRSNKSPVCAFCMAENPSEDHFLRLHRIVECMKKCEDDRTFLRPDHLRQHVRNFHKATLYEIARDRWRRDGSSNDDIENWACGFCGQGLTTWDMRETHIAGHFKDGLTMAEWGEYDQPAPAVEPAKKRRNSNENFANMFTKLARTLTGRSTGQHEHQSRLENHFSNVWDSVPPTGPSVSAAPLLPDMVFDSFMAEVCGNRIGSCDPTVASADGQCFPHDSAPAPAFHTGENMDLDLDTFTDAFLNVGSMKFQRPWDQQQE